MSAPVTDAHKAIWAQLYNLAHREIFEDFDESSNGLATQLIADSSAQARQLIAESDEQATQLIADSEAKALSSLAMVAAGSADRNVSLRLERDQLRQQVANLTHSNDSHRETAETWRAAAIERDQLRAVFPKILAALGNGACCAPDVSVEFIKAIPNEVAGVVAQLRAERDWLKTWQDQAETNYVIGEPLAKKLRDTEVEREQLRAENERLRRAYVRPDDIRVQLESAIARAESAEREVQRLKSDGAASAFVTMSCRASRAETDRNNLRADLDAIKAILNEEKARADRAEAELDGIRALADRRNKRYHVEDTTHQLVAALDQALDIAQAELADLKANNRFQRGHSAGYAEAKANCEAELAAERAKVRVLREACESIEEQWDKNHSANPFHAGNVMQSHAMRALAATEDAQ